MVAERTTRRNAVLDQSFQNDGITWYIEHHELCTRVRYFKMDTLTHCPFNWPFPYDQGINIPNEQCCGNVPAPL